MSHQIAVYLPRSLITLANNALREVNTQFLAYTGPDGISSTSRGGLVIQINKRIKRGLGVTNLKDELNESQQFSLAILYNRIASVMNEGMAKLQNRRDIKAKIYETKDSAKRLTARE